MHVNRGTTAADGIRYSRTDSPAERFVRGRAVEPAGRDLRFASEKIPPSEETSPRASIVTSTLSSQQVPPRLHKAPQAVARPASAPGRRQAVVVMRSQISAPVLVNDITGLTHS